MKKYFAETLQAISFKIDVYLLHVKVSSFQKVTFFLPYIILNRDVFDLSFCLLDDVTDYHNLRRIKLKKIVSIGRFVLATQ